MFSNGDKSPLNPAQPHMFYRTFTAAMAGLVSAVTLICIIMFMYEWIITGIFPGQVASAIMGIILFGIPGAVGGVISAAMGEKVIGPRKWGPTIGGCIGGIAIALLETWLLAPALFIRTD